MTEEEIRWRAVNEEIDAFRVFLMTDRWHSPRQKRRLGILCGIVVLAILGATLWPFDFFPANKVSWLPGANGIAFAGRGLVASKTPLEAREEGAEKSACLEILLRPASVEGSTTILSFSAPGNPSQFLVRQWTDGLLVTHDVLNPQKKLKRTKFDVDHAFRASKLLLLTLNFESTGTTVYINRNPVKVLPRFAISKDELSGQIFLGTAPEDYQPWSGEVHGLAIYSKGLTTTQLVQHYGAWMTEARVDAPDLDGATAYYAFTEREGRDIHNKVLSGPDLEMPKHFTIPRKAFLKSPIREFEASWDYLNDVLRNIAGFMPLGFILCAYLRCTRNRNQAILLAILAGGILSFSIEVLQFYVPQRNSGITDILTNTLGTGLGAALAVPTIIRTVLVRTRLIPASVSSDSQPL